MIYNACLPLIDWDLFDFLLFYLSCYILLLLNNGWFPSTKALDLSIHLWIGLLFNKILFKANCFNLFFGKLVGYTFISDGCIDLEHRNLIKGGLIYQ